jgi:pimeloyl-ACP methyl ester carboxylesterase
MNPGLENIHVSAWPDAPAVAGPRILRVDYVSGADGQKDWAVLMPQDGAETLAVMLHGHGSGGDQLLTRPDIRDRWLPALRSAGLGIVCPNLRGNAWMSPAAAGDLRQLIAWVRERYAMRRVLLVGGSMGGTSVLIYAALHPEEVDGVVAICPAADLPEYWRWAVRNAAQRPILGQIARAIQEQYGSTPDQSPELFTRHSALAQEARLTMPVALAHGTADATIPFEPTRQLAACLEERGRVHYEEMPGGNHDAPLVNGPEMFNWVLGLI